MTNKTRRVCVAHYVYQKGVAKHPTSFYYFPVIPLDVDYNIIAFRPPKVGEQYIGVGEGNSIYRLSTPSRYMYESPRLIVTLKKRKRRCLYLEEVFSGEGEHNDGYLVDGTPYRIVYDFLMRE